MGGKPVLVRVLAAGVVVACLTGVLAAAPSSGDAGRSATAGATSARSWGTVNARYWSEWSAGFGVSPGWTGSIAGCALGTDSSAANTAAKRAINFARWLTGLSPITLGTTYDARALSASLIMEANNVFTHNLTPGLRCFSDAGKLGAQRGNLAYRYPTITPVRAIGQFLNDGDPGNYMAPHRRWMLYPASTTMGVGTTHQFSTAYVVGVPTSSRQASPSYVRWPAAGWFPNPLAPSSRWSLSGRGLKFANATVSVYRSGKRLGTHKQRVVSGYGLPTLVWTMPSGYAKTGTFKVVVKGIHRTGKKKAFGTTYEVKLFTPHH